MQDKDTSDALLTTVEAGESTDAGSMPASDAEEERPKHKKRSKGKGGKRRRKSKSKSHHREYVSIQLKDDREQLKKPLSNSSDSSEQDGESIKKKFDALLEIDSKNYLPAEKSIKDGGAGWNVEDNIYNNTEGQTNQKLPRDEIIPRYHDTKAYLNNINGRIVHKSMNWFGEGILYFVDIALLAALYNAVGGYVDGALCPGEIPVACPTATPTTTAPTTIAPTASLDINATAMNTTAMPAEQCFGPNAKRSWCRRQPSTIAAQGAAAFAITLFAGIGLVESGKKIVKTHKSFTALYEEIDKAVEDMKEEHLYNKNTLTFKLSVIDYARFKFWEELALSQGYTNMKKFFRAFNSAKISAVDMNLQTGLMSYFVYLTQTKNNDAEVLEALSGSSGQAKIESFIDHYVKIYKASLKKGYLWHTFENVIPAEDTMYFLDSALGFDLFSKQGNFAYVEAAQLDTSKKEKQEKSRTSGQKKKKVKHSKLEKIDLSSSLSPHELDEVVSDEPIDLQPDDIEAPRHSDYKMKYSPKAVDNYTAICIPMTFGQEGKDTQKFFDTYDLATLFKKRLDQPNVKGMRMAQDAIVTSILNQRTRYNTLWHYGSLGTQAILGSVFGFAGSVTTTDDQVQWEQTTATICLALGAAATEVFKRYNKEVADYAQANKQRYANSVRNFIAAGFIKYDKKNQELVLSKNMQYIQWVATTMPVMLCDHFNVKIDKCNAGEIYMMVYNTLSKYYKDEKHMNYGIEDHDHAMRIAESLLSILKKKFGYGALNIAHCKSPFSISLIHEISDEVMNKAIRKTFNFTSNARDIVRIVENFKATTKENDLRETFLSTAVQEIREYKRDCKARIHEEQQNKIVKEMIDLWGEGLIHDKMEKGEVRSICERVTGMRKESQAEVAVRG